MDGNRFRPYHRDLPYTTVVKGDGKYMSYRRRASILAKTYRDDHMLRLHEEYPAYHWGLQQGAISAKAHREAIRRIGPRPITA